MYSKRIHSNAQVIWLFDYTSLLSMSDDKNRLVFLSEREMNILWQSTINIDLWRSRVFTEATGDVYTIVDELQFEEFKGWVSDTRLSLGDYEMIEPILEEIRDAIIALAERECCPGGGVGGGSGGAGLDEAAPSVITHTPEDRLGEPPEGFESWAEADTYKCDMAYYIINQLKVDIATTGLLAAGYSGAAALGGALIAALLTPIGWAVIIGLSGLAISWFLLGAEVSLLTSFVEANKDDLVCGLLDGNTVADSIGTFGDKVDELIPEDSGISTYGLVAEYLAKQYIKTFATVDSINRLYKRVFYPIPTGNDCSACSVADWAILDGGYGSGDTNANPMVLSGVLISGRYRLYMCRAEGSDDVTFTSQTGYTPSPSTGGADDSITVDTANCSGSVTGDLYSDDDFPTSTTFNGAAWIGFNSTTPFTVTLTKA